MPGNQPGATGLRRLAYGQVASRMTTYTPPAFMTPVQQAYNRQADLIDSARAPGMIAASRLGQLRGVVHQSWEQGQDPGVHGPAMEVMQRRTLQDTARRASAAIHADMLRNSHHNVRAGSTTVDETVERVSSTVDKGADVVDGTSRRPHTYFDVGIPGRPSQEWDELLRPDKVGGSLMDDLYDAQLLHERSAPIEERVTASPPLRRSRKTPMKGQGTLF